MPRVRGDGRLEAFRDGFATTVRPELMLRAGRCQEMGLAGTGSVEACLQPNPGIHRDQ